MAVQTISLATDYGNSGEGGQRLHPRYRLGPYTGCQMSDVDDGRLWWARVLNLSPGGLSLVVHQPSEPGQPLCILLTHKSRSFAYLLQARVVHVREDTESAGRFLLGCAFNKELQEADLREVLAESFLG